MNKAAGKLFSLHGVWLDACLPSESGRCVVMMSDWVPERATTNCRNENKKDVDSGGLVDGRIDARPANRQAGMREAVTHEKPMKIRSGPRTDEPGLLGH